MVSDILKRIRSAFPPGPIDGPVATHDCEECNALNQAFANKQWDEPDPSFIDENDANLPLISDAAYLKVLPAWLARAISNPDGPVGEMLLVNLSSEPRTQGASPSQVACIIEVARYIAASSLFGTDEPMNTAMLAEIQRMWCGSELP